MDSIFWSSVLLSLNMLGSGSTERYLNFCLNNLVAYTCASVCWFLIEWADDRAAAVCKMRNPVVKFRPVSDCIEVIFYLKKVKTVYVIITKTVTKINIYRIYDLSYLFFQFFSWYHPRRRCDTSLLCGTICMAPGQVSV